MRIRRLATAAVAVAVGATTLAAAPAVAHGIILVVRPFDR